MEESRQFQAEVRELLHLVINSLYSNKDIFLRELIANAADAIDKARFESLTRPEMASEWQIGIEADKKKNTLTINDNGIGMTREELIRDIGTIAKSGTRAFMEMLKEKKDAGVPDLIGQFGVGFYSAFMVAEKIVIVSKKAGSDAPPTRWESKGESEYTLSDAVKADHGTEITLHLKGDSLSYLEEWKIRELVKKYSDFIEFPIRLLSQEKGKDSGADWNLLNTGKALWLRPSSSVSEEEYKSFYAHLSHFDSEPALRIHYSAEGSIDFKALLFLPSKAPFDLFTPEQNRRGVQLYIRRVFITDENDIVLPEYFRFVKGVVESNDLPLNVSREMLQDSPQISKLKKNLVRKLLSEMKKMQENSFDAYAAFYAEFKNSIKEGLHSDYANKEALTDLLLFDSMKHCSEKPISLKQYCSEMSGAQNEIYCFLCEKKSDADSSPHLEFFRENGLDVLILPDPIDEIIIPEISEYSGKKLKIVGKSDINYDAIVPEQTKKLVESANKDNSEFLKYLMKHFDKYVKNVCFSSALSGVPCRIKTDEFAPGAHFEKLMKAMKRDIPESKGTLELNPSNSIIQSLCSIFKKNPGDKRIEDSIEILFDQALIADGKPARNPGLFSKKISSMLSSTLG